MLPEIISFVKKTFKDSGEFYVVGGASRDFILKREPHDYDVATTLTPDQIKAFVPEADFTFSHLGTVNLKYKNENITFQTMRTESNYDDRRHPKKVEFIKDYIQDSYRRDFTINAIYLGMDGVIYDPQEGIADIRAKQLRMIGDPDTRLREDPLRIIRAYRFKYLLDFDFEPALLQSLIENRVLISQINPQKVQEEINKSSPEYRDFIKSEILY